MTTPSTLPYPANQRPGGNGHRDWSAEDDARWEALIRLPQAHSKGHGQWQACCPAHDDVEPSLSFKRDGSGNILAHCFAGCTFEDILKALATNTRRPASVATAPKKCAEWGRTIATYNYTDADGMLLYQVIRREHKDFTQRRPDGMGGWVYNLDGVQRVPYRLPDLLAPEKLGRGQTDPVYVAEGEKDVNMLYEHGLIATCNSGGALKWSRDIHAPYLEGRSVVVIPDNDKPGREHANIVARSLLGIASPVSILCLEGLPVGGDVSDWLANGHTAAELEQLAHASLEAPTYHIDADLDSEPELQEPIDVYRMSPINTASYGNVSGLIRLADVVPENVTPLWANHFFLGKLHICEGDPGLGKGLITADITARVTNNSPMPDGSHSGLDEPAGVVLLTTAEDGLADTIRPRLDAAGADVTRVAALVTVPDGTDHRMPTLADISDLERAIEAVDAKLLIIDPLMAYLPGDVNSYRDQDIRRILAPLAELGNRTGTAIVVVRHLTKGVGSNAIYRGGGSIGIIGAARAAFVVAKDPQDETGERRIFACSKNNLAPIPASLRYQIEPAPNGSARIVWSGEVDYSADSLLSMQEDEEGHTARTEAEAFLQSLLDGGPLAATRVQKEAQNAGIASRTLNRAKKTLGIRSYREGFGPGGEWVWELPAKAT